MWTDLYAYLLQHGYFFAQDKSGEDELRDDDVHDNSLPGLLGPGPRHHHHGAQVPLHPGRLRLRHPGHLREHERQLESP